MVMPESQRTIVVIVRSSPRSLHQPHDAHETVPRSRYSKRRVDGPARGLATRPAPFATSTEELNPPVPPPPPVPVAVPVAVPPVPASALAELVALVIGLADSAAAAVAVDIADAVRAHAAADIVEGVATTLA